MTTALIGKTGDLAQKARVAVVSRTAASTMSSLLARAGHEALDFPDWSSFHANQELGAIDLLLCDESLAADAPTGLGSPTIAIADHATTTTKSGSMPVVTLATLESSLDVLVTLATQLNRSLTRQHELARIVDGLHSGSAMVGRSPVMRRLASAISRAADCDATVLIEGPAGSGKSLTARMVHCKSRRGNKPIVTAEGEAVTADSLGKLLAEAKGTTFVLENIERLPTAAQAVLVRSLKERSGPNGQGAARIVATTSAHLPELVARGAFREDLFYRLHAMPLVVPALRERTEDIALLAQAVAEAAASASGRATTLSPAAMMLLEAMTWPGNVAQLEATVRRALVQAGGGTVEREHIQPPAAAAATGAARTNTPSAAAESTELTEDSILPFEEEEQRMLSRALRATKGNVRRAAQLLGIGRATLYRKIQQYRLSLQ